MTGTQWTQPNRGATVGRLAIAFGLTMTSAMLDAAERKTALALIRDDFDERDHIRAIEAVRRVVAGEE